jgi:CRP/FNR family transcriptional regulator, cyclic AMP receptor protein
MIAESHAPRNEYEDPALAKERLETEPLRSRVALHPFFAGMKPDYLELLAKCAMAAHFRKGQTILREGEFANSFYVIESGSVSLESGAGLGDPVLFETIGPGDLLGWSWLFPPYVWRFTARATEPVSSLFFYGAILREHCQNDHSLGYELLKRAAAVMLRRMQAARDHMLRAQRND